MSKVKRGQFPRGKKSANETAEIVRTWEESYVPTKKEESPTAVRGV